jgi:hypothetical protein
VHKTGGLSLFWKKKNDADNEIIIELDTDERRQGIRIQPMDDIIVHHNAEEFKLIDISFMGLAFAPISDKLTISDTYKSGRQLTISFRLPSFKAPGVTVNAEIEAIEIHCQVQIVQIRSAVCCCQFVTLEQHAQIQVDQFILDEQKKQIHHRHKMETIQSS